MKGNPENYGANSDLVINAYDLAREVWAPQRRLYYAGMILLTIIAVGTVGFQTLGGDRWSWWDCLYMTVITLSTVGYSETLPGMDHVPYARAWTLGLIVLGSGSLLYFASLLTAFIVEGDLGGVLRRNRMQKLINSMNDHVVVCGVGNTGIHVVKELLATKTQFVVIDRDTARVHHVAEEMGEEIVHIIGDATDDDVLFAAGITRASGLVAVLHDDPENLYLTLTGRSLNENLRIVSKAVDPVAQPKMLRAGANSVVMPHYIGGMRLVSEMIRPQVVEFLDQMLRNSDQPLRISQIEVVPNSALSGEALKDAGLRVKANALVLAIRHPDRTYTYNPDPTMVLEVGMTLILLGDAARLSKVH